MRPCTHPPAWPSREIFSARVSEVTTPEKATLPAMRGHPELRLAACSSGKRRLGSSGGPVSSVPALAMERFKDLSSTFQLVMEWRWECSTVLTSFRGVGRAVMQRCFPPS